MASQKFQNSVEVVNKMQLISFVQTVVLLIKLILFQAAELKTHFQN